MLRVLTVSIAVVLGAVAATNATTTRQRSPAAFSLVLESTASGWAARCDSGCRWKELSFGCARACGATIDANGVLTLNAPPTEAAAFRFNVERSPNGVRASAKTGTAWELLTWTCRLDPCRARIDGYGVSGIDQAR